MKFVERIFERILWSSRLTVLVAVIASLIVALGVFYLTSVDVFYLVIHLADYIDPTLTDQMRTSLRLNLVAEVVAVVDGYLLAAIMLILALGMYELFINKIDEAENSEFAARLLLIRSFDDLKDRLARVVLLILIVKFFQQALRLKYEDTLDLLFLAIGIVLIGAAIFLSHQKDTH